MVKGPDQRNHVEWQESFLEGANSFTFVPADGQGNRNLIEPYPQYFFRNGDEKIQGENNTLIVLGRDRSPAAADEVFVNNKQSLAVRVYPELEDSIGISLKSQGRPAILQQLHAWQMNSIY